MSHHQIGWWNGTDQGTEYGDQVLRNAILQVLKPVFLSEKNNKIYITHGGTAVIGNEIRSGDGYCPLFAYIPPLDPSGLGDPQFKKSFHIRYAYITGAMANGIASVEMVRAAGDAGMLGFFGAGGLSVEQIDKAIHSLQKNMGDKPFGINLIHSPNDPELESATVRLYLDRGIHLVSAAAYLRLTLPLVYYRVKGIHRDSSGNIICPNRIKAKISRIEVAQQFFSPPPEKIINQLLDKKMITREEAELARFIPMADTMTAEADSGGHTDNRPALSLLPTILSLKSRMIQEHKYQTPLFVGLGGGIATPESAAAAFSMGAAFVLTGTVNQACIESGTSETVRHMLAEAGQADVTMAPSADMFQMGVKVQVLKRGTMFPVRASKLYDLYNRHDRYEDIPEKERTTLEQNFFRSGFEEEWERTKAFFRIRDPRQITRAEAEPKHKMALVFRSYLGRSSNWAVSGDPSRKIDYQIWCGPAIGAFNEWVKGSFLEKPENRKTAVVALNILLGASVVTRANWLRNQGIEIRDDFFRFSPLPDEEIRKIITP
ncbi:MAG: PfaD family polyunsaturated fatty acid/polyketide biosynthesis protein [Desulfobacteraceae bacterium]|nr:MAG: PfaD family polyunsaturated fatty acid/polyketide biosynthesis protein [Desulfobacteraceae bacterium]